MTFESMLQRAIFQYNADWDDYEEYAPHVDAYINDGYDQILYALTDLHLDEDARYKTLNVDEDLETEPKIPQWTHLAVCDYATYMLYRNGNVQKQNRGTLFLRNFQEVLSRCELMKSKATVDAETGEITFDNRPIQFTHYWP